MEIRVISKRENKLLERVEVEFEVLYPNQPTPNRFEVKEKLAALLAKDRSLVFIKRMVPRAGTPTAKGLAHVYDSLERAELVENKYIIERNTPKAVEEASR
ncbi:MAG: 30S ribosomal protein S24e [Candidatus Odinarchaeota archaeon]|nr:30S ribosomal protein S24e [Candidatus Odinarchaeota archaeon]